MKYLLIYFAFSTLISCQKEKKIESLAGDEVIGTYAGSSGSLPIRIQVYKISEQKYGIRKLDPAPYPEFTFRYDFNLAGVFNYKVLSQTSGSVTLNESSTAGYFSVQNNFAFTLKDVNSGTTWSFSGYR